VATLAAALLVASAPAASAARLPDAEVFTANEQARERLMGGSMTLDHRLILIASSGDLRLAKRFARKIGGRVKDATIRRGHREFVR
jgi:hypothetical protein